MISLCYPSLPKIALNPSFPKNNNSSPIDFFQTKLSSFFEKNFHLNLDFSFILFWLCFVLLFLFWFFFIYLEPRVLSEPPSLLSFFLSFSFVFFLFSLFSLLSLSFSFLSLDWNKTLDSRFTCFLFLSFYCHFHLANRQTAESRADKIWSYPPIEPNILVILLGNPFTLLNHGSQTPWLCCLRADFFRIPSNTCIHPCLFTLRLLRTELYCCRWFHFLSFHNDHWCSPQCPHIPLPAEWMVWPFFARFPSSIFIFYRLCFICRIRLFPNSCNGWPRIADTYLMVHFSHFLFNLPGVELLVVRLDPMDKEIPWIFGGLNGSHFIPVTCFRLKNQ